MRLSTLVRDTLPIPPITATSIKIRKEKKVPLSTVKTSGSREARIEPPALYWRAMMPDWMMHMAITMIKLVFCPYRSPTRPLMVE